MKSDMMGNLDRSCFEAEAFRSRETKVGLIERYQGEEDLHQQMLELILDVLGREGRMMVVILQRRGWKSEVEVVARKRSLVAGAKLEWVFSKEGTSYSGATPKAG